MPTISLSFSSLLLNTPLSSLFLPSSTTTTPPPPPPPQQATATVKNAMDAVELRRVFEMFDHNGDGRITIHELTASLRNMGIVIPDSDLAHMIGTIDVNGDGCVDGTEFEALYRLITAERDDGEEEDIKEAFNVFDKNGDGFIEVEELRSVLGSLGLGSGRSVEDCKMMIMKVDVDGDGRVSFKEFKKMMKEGGFAALN